MCAVTLQPRRWVYQDRMRYSRYAIGSLACLMIACSSDRVVAPRLVTIDGIPYRGQASLNRDFMPFAPPDGEPLTLGIRIFTADSSAIPASVTADSAWVYNGNAVWRTAVVAGEPRNTSSFDVGAVGGPKWGPGIEVDVVVRLRDGAGHSFLLQAPRQLITRSD